MTAATVGLLLALVSAAGIAALAALHPKRRRLDDRRLTRFTALALTLAPGVWSALALRPVEFLIWIGATVILGWGIAAIASATDGSARAD